MQFIYDRHEQLTTSLSTGPSKETNVMNRFGVWVLNGILSVVEFEHT